MKTIFLPFLDTVATNSFPFFFFALLLIDSAFVGSTEPRVRRTCKVITPLRTLLDWRSKDGRRPLRSEFRSLLLQSVNGSKYWGFLFSLSHPPFEHSLR